MVFNSKLILVELTDPIVKRPASLKQKQQKSKLRLSFGPGETSMVEDEDQASEVVAPPPKRHGLGRQALERSTTQRLFSPVQRTPIRVGQDQDRPSYSADYLKELRHSTPSTPKFTPPDEGANDEKVIDVTAKFGELAKVSSMPSVIPSEAEVREKKARRARITREQDYISLDDTVEDDSYLDLKSEEKPEEGTRLIRDDEDFAEGFDEFVEDGRVSLGKKAEREQNRRQRETMRDLIDEAEALSDEADSDLEEKAAYETAQTRAAIGMRNGGAANGADQRTATPPKVTSLPRLSTCIDRLRATMITVENSRSQMINRMEELRREKADIAVREVDIQAMIKEAGENYERLRREAGIASDASGDVQRSSRGLENIGGST